MSDPERRSAIEVPQAGVCVVCDCTEERPCIDEEGQACTWIDQTRTMCSACSDGAFGDDDSWEYDDDEGPLGAEPPDYFEVEDLDVFDEEDVL